MLRFIGCEYYAIVVFKAILIERFHVPEDESPKIAAAWEYGDGKAVRSFDIDAYRGIFGAELGTLLYQHQYPHPKDRLLYYIFGVIPELPAEKEKRDKEGRETRAKQVISSSENG